MPWSGCTDEVGPSGAGGSRSAAGCRCRPACPAGRSASRVLGRIGSHDQRVARIRARQVGGDPQPGVLRRSGRPWRCGPRRRPVRRAAHARSPRRTRPRPRPCPGARRSPVGLDDHDPARPAVALERVADEAGLGERERAAARPDRGSRVAVHSANRSRTARSSAAVGVATEALQRLPQQARGRGAGSSARSPPAPRGSSSGQPPPQLRRARPRARGRPGRPGPRPRPGVAARRASRGTSGGRPVDRARRSRAADAASILGRRLRERQVVGGDEPRAEAPDQPRPERPPGPTGRRRRPRSRRAPRSSRRPMAHGPPRATTIAANRPIVGPGSNAAIRAPVSAASASRPVRRTGCDRDRRTGGRRRRGRPAGPSGRPRRPGSRDRASGPTRPLDRRERDVGERPRRPVLPRSGPSAGLQGAARTADRAPGRGRRRVRAASTASRSWWRIWSSPTTTESRPTATAIAWRMRPRRRRGPAAGRAAEPARRTPPRSLRGRSTPRPGGTSRPSAADVELGRSRLAKRLALRRPARARAWVDERDDGPGSRPRHRGPRRAPSDQRPALPAGARRSARL